MHDFRALFRARQVSSPYLQPSNFVYPGDSPVVVADLFGEISPEALESQAYVRLSLWQAEDIFSIGFGLSF